MCLGLPGRIVSVQDGGARGQVDVLGTLRPIDLSLLSAPVLSGEHVLIHSGIAMQRISAEQAAEVEAAFRHPGDGAGGGIRVGDPAPEGPPPDTPRG